MMKKRILAIMACGILVAATAGFGTAETADAANVTEPSYGSDIDERGREYVDEFDPDTNQVIDFYEVEFQIPESWTKVDSSSGLVYNSDSDNGTLSISGGRAGQSYDMTMEEVQDEAIASVDGGDSFVETGREVVTILDDMPALYFTCTQILSGIPLDICALAFSTDDYIYIFSYADRQDSGYNHSQEFDEIINSISLAPAADTVTYYEVSFWTPETWVNASTDDEQVMFQTDSGAMIVNSEEGSFGTDFMGLEENQVAFISAYEDKDSFELTDRQTITVLDDIPALYFTYSFLMDGEPMNYGVTMFSTDERLYLFAYEEFITNGDSQMDYFAEIIDSISWATDVEEEYLEEENLEEEPGETEEPFAESEGITLSYDSDGTLEACVIVDNNDINITVESLETDSSGDVIFSLYLENKTDDINLMFAVDDVSVNGRMCDPFWAKSVPAGMNAYSEMEFSKRVLDKAGINYISNVEMTIRVYDDDDWSADDYYNDIVILNVPNSSEEPMIYDIISESGYSETVLVDTGGVRVSVVDYSEEDGFIIYIENYSDQNIMVSADDVAVNGTMCDPFWAKSVPAGKSAYKEMSWSSSKLEESKIESIENVQMNLRIYDDDDWGADDIFNGTVEFSAK